MSESSPVSNTRALLHFAAVLLVFGLLILNWWSPIGIRLFSGTLNVLVFCLALAAAPVSLAMSARSFGPVIRWTVWVIATALYVPIFFALMFVVSGFVPEMRHGVGIESLVRSVPMPPGRIAIYQVDTMFSGTILLLRLERTLLPGVLLARDLAFVNASELQKLVLRSPDEICLSFESSAPNVAGGVVEIQATQKIQPLLTWTEPVWLDDTSTPPVAAGTACLPKATSKESLTLK